MMGPVYAQWNGFAEVTEHFYGRFLPEARRLAEGHPEAAAAIGQILASPGHEWLRRDGAEDRAAVEAFYRDPPGEVRPGGPLKDPPRAILRAGAESSAPGESPSRTGGGGSGPDGTHSPRGNWALAPAPGGRPAEVQVLRDACKSHPPPGTET